MGGCGIAGGVRDGNSELARRRECQHGIAQVVRAAQRHFHAHAVEHEPARAVRIEAVFARRHVTRAKTRRHDAARATARLGDEPGFVGRNDGEVRTVE